MRGWVAALLSLTAGCGRVQAGANDAGASPATLASVASAAAADAAGRPPPSSAPPPAPPSSRLVRVCRALEVKGTPAFEAPSLGGADDAGTKRVAGGDVVAGWLALGDGDLVTARLPRSGRDVTVLGPGLADPCGEEEEAWLLRGRFRGMRGGGEKPGAEEWVVTPSAVVRYGAAVVEVGVEGTATRVTVQGGGASVVGASDLTWAAVGSDKPLVVQGAPLGDAATRDASARCAERQAAAKKLEDTLLEPGATAAPAFADTAMRANDARLLARAACAMARLRADTRTASHAAAPKR
ncbi:MAG TPA: hypothetical protein VGI39_06190 [Polyangiaceae bacterium]